jgi:hypothetical protein
MARTTYVSVPFGLSSVPWIFTKILKPVAALLREHGVRLTVYIDDILIMAESKELAEEHTAALVLSVLKILGFPPIGEVNDSAYPDNRFPLAMRLQVPGERSGKRPKPS